MVIYTTELVGMIGKLTEETYTSQASFLDGVMMPVYNPKRMEKPNFNDKRIKCGFVGVSGIRLTANRCQRSV